MYYELNAVLVLIASQIPPYQGMELQLECADVTEEPKTSTKVMQFSTWVSVIQVA